MKSIYVILTRTNTILSRIINIVTNDKFTHASISLDKNLETMYSFGRRNVYNPFIGTFVIENFNEGVYGFHEYLHGQVIEIEVTNEQYESVEKLTNNFILNNESYKYNYIGLINILLKRESFSENKFLCSEFVYYILNSSNIIDLKIPRNLVRPQYFEKLNGKVIYEGNLKDIYINSDYLKFLQTMPT
ncbi:MAG: hypothetical protein AB7V48_14750 [Sedimentibacter sp.]